MTSSIQLHPLPLAGYLLISMAHLCAPYVYRYENGCWYVSDEGEEYFIIEVDGGLKLIENPF